MCILLKEGSKVILKALYTTIKQTMFASFVMTKEEARKILNVQENSLNRLDENFKTYHNNNKGFAYLQSKIINAYRVLRHE